MTAHRKTITVLITLITVVASLMTIYEFTFPRQSVVVNTTEVVSATSVVGATSVIIETSVVTTSQTNTGPFDFAIQGDPRYSSSGIRFCANDVYRTYRISVVVLRGNPQPVRLSYRQLPPGIASISFSVEYGTPPFDSDVTLFLSSPPLASGEYYVTIVAESPGVTRTITIPIRFTAPCYP